MESPYKRLVAVLLLTIKILSVFAWNCVCDLVSLFNFKSFRGTFQPRNGETKLLTYDEWRTRQKDLDRIRGVDGWASYPNHRDYNFQCLQDFRRELDDAQRRNDYHHVCSRLRAQLDRNICRILSPTLYQNSFIQTKRLIHDYIQDMSRCIWYVAKWEGSPLNQWSQKVTVLHEVKDQVFGRTTLVLTGGAMISMCHIGVVKVLFQQRLLPQIITGVSTGSLVAALVGVSSDQELRTLLEVKDINLRAFAAHVKRQREASWLSRAWKTFQRRRFRLSTTGHIFDIELLRSFAKDNLGDMTFEEAYQKTGRILSITIAMPDVQGMPQLLNYITAPHVVIWSAVVASIATSRSMYAPTQLFYKSEDGSLVEYHAPDSAHNRIHSGYLDEPKPPLQRLAELFNVNHFVVSQTRPYIFPFIWAQRATVNTPALGKLVRLTLREGLHWLTRPNIFGLLPTFIHRILLDEVVPSSAESWSKLHITPNVRIRDLFDIFEIPTQKALKKWSRIGEESTWPFLCQLEVRCAVEFELDRAFDSVRRRKDSLVV